MARTQQLELPITGKLRIGPTVRVQLVRDAQSLCTATITGPEEVFALVREEVPTWDRERFFTLILDTKNRLLDVDEVSVGTLQASLVHPREVMKTLILANAAAFICLHNHPSGDPTPSAEDVRITRRLREVGELLGIPCLDHIVVGDGRFVSMKDSGQL